MVAKKAAKKATKKAAKKVAKRVAKRGPDLAVVKQAVADIDTLLDTRKKLDLELRKVERHLKKMLGHLYAPV